jgi:hypothetical protein
MNTRPLSKEYLCKRLLLVNYGYSTVAADPFEANLLEVAPSGEYAKIKIKKVDSTPYIKWCHVNDYVVLEVLKEEPRVNEEWIRELQEKEIRDREEFNKHSSPTAKPSYWDTLPTSICSSDYADAPDFHATNYSAEVKKQKWVHGICNPPSPDWKKKK